MIILLLCSITILILINILITFPLKRLFEISKIDENVVNVSIIIAARNEQTNLTKLIQSLNKLDYSEDLFEVIIVDDNSVDETLSVLKELTKEFDNFSIYSNTETNLTGKRNALTLGIKHSKFSNILITDADCRPEKKWLQSYSKKFKDGYDLLFGIAPFIQHKKLINKISCIENLRNSILTFSMASIGLPYSAAARNIGFSKKAFDQLGGYLNTKDTISGDDDLLLREAVKNKMKIGVVTDSLSFVYSDTKETLSEYLQQKARHTQTSFHYLITHQLILGFWHLLNLAFLVSPLLMFVNPLFGLLLPAKLIIDFIVVQFHQRKFGYKFSFFETFYLQIFYELFLIINFFNAQFMHVKWK